MHKIRVVNLDAGALMQDEGVVKAVVRKLKIQAKVTMMADNLEITRLGLLNSVPAIEVDGKIVCKKQPIKFAQVKELFLRLDLDKR